MEGEKSESDDVLTIRIKDQVGEEMIFKVKKTTKIEKVMNAYAQRRGVSISSLKFLFDGKRVTADQTPKLLEMDDNDQLDVMLMQEGGYQLRVL